MSIGFTVSGELTKRDPDGFTRTRSGSGDEVEESVVVDKRPDDAEWNEIEEIRGSVDAHLLTHDQLSDEALARCADYAEAGRQLLKLEQLLARLVPEEAIEDDG